jgi:hypothetical protein
MLTVSAKYAVIALYNSKKPKITIALVDDYEIALALAARIRFISENIAQHGDLFTEEDRADMATIRKLMIAHGIGLYPVSSLHLSVAAQSVISL